MTIAFAYQDIAVLACLSGLMAIDERAGWHSLIAQPVFAGMLVGLVLGEFAVAVSVGVILELVWLSVLPMRGMRRPDAVAGSVVGAGTAGLLIRYTGDPRVVLVVSLSAAMGLVGGEILGSVGRRIHNLREKALGAFGREVTGESASSQRLSLYMLASVGFVFVAEALVVAVFLPLFVTASEWITGAVGTTFTVGARTWADLVPALGAGAAIQLYWHKQQNRYLILCAGIVLLLLWFR